MRANMHGCHIKPRLEVLVMKLTERVKRKLQSFLEIQPACPQNVNIIESTDFTTDVFRSQIWYRGDTAELSQFFHQLCLSNGEINSMFWASVPTAKTVRRIHSGLPAIIADTLAYIVYSDMDDIDFGEKAKGKSEWEDITDISCGGMDFTQLVGQSVIDTLVDGDGAFKISVDSDTSQYPFVEFIGADMIEYEYHKGRITAIIFKTDYQVHSQKYTLCERYGIGRIESKLFDSNGNEVPLSICEQLAGINPVVEFAGNYMMAVPLKFYSSKNSRAEANHYLTEVNQIALTHWTKLFHNGGTQSDVDVYNDISHLNLFRKTLKQVNIWTIMNLVMIILLLIFHFRRALHKRLMSLSLKLNTRLL